MPNYQQITEILKAGGVILYPTDTVWGIGCDATNPTAVARVFAIKQRSESKSLIILVSSIAMLQAQVKPGLEVKIGGNIAGLYYADSSNSDRTFTPGFHTGALFSLNFPTGLALETGLMLNTKGQAYEYKYKEGKEKQISELHYTYGYLEMPFYVGYKLKLRNVKLVWKAGPYVAAALWGNSREEWAYYKKDKLKDYKMIEAVYSKVDGRVDNLERIVEEFSK